VPNIWEDGTIGPEDLAAFIQVLEEAVGDTKRIATTERMIPVIEQQNCVFSQYYGKFQVIVANLDCNPSASWIAIQMGLSKEMKDSFTYSNMPGNLPAFVTDCQKQVNQIGQRCEELAAQNNREGVSFASLRPPVQLNAVKSAPTRTVAQYTGPMPIYPSASKRRNLAEDRAKWFADGRCLYCGGFIHLAGECATRKHAQTFKAAAAYVKEEGTRTGSMESGNN